jgi:hypothetical protein
MASASSSSEPEMVRAADAQRRARLDELAEARRHLDKELALLHKELGMDAEPRDRRPAQDIPVQEEPREGNGDQRERRPAAEQPRPRTNATDAWADTRQQPTHQRGSERRRQRRH